MSEVDRVKVRTKAPRRFHGNRYTCPQPESTQQEEATPSEENPGVQTPTTAPTASPSNEDNPQNLRTQKLMKLIIFKLHQ